MAGELAESLHARGEVDGWETRLVRTVGTHGNGVGELYEALREYSCHLRTKDRLPVLRERQIRRELSERVEARLARRLDAAPGRERLRRAAAARVRAGEDDPYSASEQLLREL